MIYSTCKFELAFALNELHIEVLQYSIFQFLLALKDFSKQRSSIVKKKIMYISCSISYFAKTWTTKELRIVLFLEFTHWVYTT